MKKAVLVMAYGGPDSLDDIEPYLQDIRGGRPTSPDLVQEIRERYAKIGGRSPLLEITNAQAAALEKCLNELSSCGEEFKVYVGMRHWKPYIRDTVNRIAADEIQEGVAFCMAPHASRMSSGAYLQKLREAEASLSQPLHLEFIESWNDQPFLIQALAKKVREAVERFSPGDRENVFHLFTAHSLPVKLVEEGDPYASQLNETARLLAEELGLSSRQWSLAYQSAGAAGGQWLGPDIGEALPQLAGQGEKNILVTPVGFTADHVEILYDLDIEAQEIARQQEIQLVRSASLNDSPDFIKGLSELILKTGLRKKRLQSANRTIRATLQE